MVSVKIVGKNRLYAKFGKTLVKTIDASEDALFKGALFLETEIKESISGHRAEKKSVDTGRFKGSVTSKSKGLSASVSSNVDYGKFLELGTSKIAPRRHFQNSFNRNKKKIKTIIIEEYKKKL